MSVGSEPGVAAKCGVAIRPFNIGSGRVAPARRPAAIIIWGASRSARPRGSKVIVVGWMYISTTECGPSPGASN